MGMKKEIHYGFGGDRAHAIPRAPRSIRKSDFRKKIVDDINVSAFDLLATVAGKLLQESECSSASSNATAVNNQPAFGVDLIKEEPECICQQNCDEYFFKTGPASNDCDRRYISNAPLNISEEFPLAKGDAVLECFSVITKPNHAENNKNDLKLANGNNANNKEITNMVLKAPLDQQGDSLDSNIERHQESDGEEKRVVIEKKSNTCNSTPMVGNLGKRNWELPLLKNSISDSYSRLRNDVNLGNKDDDDKCTQYYKPGTKVKAIRSVPHIGDRIIKKLLKSKLCKATPNLKNCDVSDSGERVKSISKKRKSCYNRNDNYAKRKFFDQSSVVTTDDRSSEEESLANSSELDMCGDESGSTAALKAVKVCIKSFRIPELLIQVPQTSTIGLLKRTVMEAVSTMLEGGFRVGVLYRGKKIRDDSTSLLDIGISNSADSLDSLGFSLEPIVAAQPPPFSPRDPTFSLPCGTPEPINRSSVIGIPDPNLLSLGNNFESMKENMSTVSKALVAVQPMNTGALPLTSMNRRCRRSEFTPRRARRPFSVSEVEALVQAVEELGTGRWRDVKLRSFDNAYHRTYVDLKDKWKTLVHTAKISPQQRRGEAVPQELLDRVLGAHAQWSQQCNKQQLLKITPQTQIRAT